MDFLARFATINWAQVIAVVAPLASLVYRLGGMRRSRRRLDEVLQVYSNLPGKEQERMLPELREHVDRYFGDIGALATRKVDGGTVAAMIVIAVAGGTIMWGLAWAANNWGVFFWVLFALVLLFTVALIATGSKQIFKDGGVNQDIQ